VIQILLGLMVLGTLVVAYLASKYWHWGHVLTGVLLFFLAVGYAFLAAQTLKVRNEFLKAEETALANLELRQAERAALRKGSRDSAVIGRLISSEVRIPEAAEEISSIVDLEHELQLANRVQGRVWKNAQRAAAVDPNTGRVQLTIEDPKPLGLEKGAILYIFEQDGRRAKLETSQTQYIGEFRVVEAADQTVTLEPVLSLDPRQGQRLINSQAPWILYDTMPAAGREVFAGVKKSVLQKILPEASAQSFLRDGQAVTKDGKFVGDKTGATLSPDELAWHVVGFDAEGNLLGPDDLAKAEKFEYRRPLVDYSLAFTTLAKERAKMVADVQAVQQDTAKLEAALASAKKIQQYRTNEQRKLGSDLKNLTRDRKRIESYAAQLAQQVTKAEQLLAATLSSSRELAQELTATQGAGAAATEPNPAGARPATDIDAL
jgi:hypothetical protein